MLGAPDVAQSVVTGMDCKEHYSNKLQRFMMELHKVHLGNAQDHGFTASQQAETL